MDTAGGHWRAENEHFQWLRGFVSHWDGGMNPASVTPAQAARELGISASTVRRDIARGAPVVAHGGRGPGKAARLVVADYAAFRRGERVTASNLDALETAILETLRCDGGDGAPLHDSLGVGRREAALLFLSLYQRFHRRLTGRELLELPQAIERLVRVLPRSRNGQMGSALE